MIIQNKAMKQILATINNKEEAQFNLSDLSNIMYPDFIEVNECILMRQNNRNIKKLDMDHIYRVFGDKTGFEATDSHVHMMDLTKEFEKNPMVGLQFALKLLDTWECKLKREFPEYKFVMILSFDGEDSILRFHRDRKEEESWLDISSLDSYENTAILIKKV
jgi:hypothetical protein